MISVHKLFLAVMILGLVVSGCAPQPVEPTTGNETATVPTAANPVTENIKLHSDLPRESPPLTAYDNIGGLSQGNTAFATNLYLQLHGQSGNLFLSPYSISLALAMTYSGARSATETQMAQTLHFTLPQDQLHAAFNALNATLDSRQGSDEEPGFKLNIANALWGQEGFAFSPEFLDTLALNYGAGMQAVDFAQSEQARKTINDWVADQTENKITDLIPGNALNDLTRLVLTNAIYFKAAWMTPFDEKETKMDSFDLLDGSEVEVPMMRQTENFGYLKAEDYQAVELFYEGRQLSMVIMMPDEGGFDKLEADLNADQLQTIFNGLEMQRLDLFMPKFKVESSFGLAETLAAMGMPDAFDVNKADFSGMTGKPDLYITDVVHKAFVDVNEEGTEAAAATGVIMGLKSMPTGEPIEVKIDRPFLFLIRDIETGAVLFLGRVTQP